MSAKKILVTLTDFNVPGTHQNPLKDKGYEVVVVNGPINEEGWDEVLKNGPYEAVLAGLDYFTPKALEKLGSLPGGIHRSGVGIDRIDLDSCTKNKVTVTRTVGINHHAVAEHTLMLTLMWLRKARATSTALNANQWVRPLGTDLRGLTVGVVGFGWIGKEVAKRLAAFGANLLIFNRSWDEEKETVLEDIKKVQEIFGNNVSTSSVSAGTKGQFVGQFVTRVENIEKIVKQSDVISLCLASTTETRGMFNEKLLKNCKPSLLIVNAARGDLVEEATIAKLLTEKKIGGYATDVYAQEPLSSKPPFNPLLSVNETLDLPDVFLGTPHTAPLTMQTGFQQLEQAAKNLINSLEGKLDNVADYNFVLRF